MTNVIDAGDLRKYRTEIPNIVDDMGLSVYAYRLYGHLKRVAGDSGKCFQGRRKIAEICGMSAGMVTKAKQELVDRGLIELTPGNAEDSRPDLIVITNIWRQNFDAFSDATPGHQVTTPGHDVTTPGHTVTHPWSPGDHKKEPIKKEPIEESYEDDKARAHGAVFAAWSENMPGTMTPILADKLHGLIDECGAPSVIHGIVAAVEAGARNYKYIAACARNHAQGNEPPQRARPQQRGRPLSKVEGSMAAMDELEAMVKGVAHG